MSQFWKTVITLIAGIVAPLICKLFHVNLSAGTLVIWAVAVITAVLAIHSEIQQGGKTWFKRKHVASAMIAAVLLALADGFNLHLPPYAPEMVLGVWGMILGFFHLNWDELGAASAAPPSVSKP